MAQTCEQARAVIREVCENLHRMKHRNPTFGQILNSAVADSHILLSDSTQMFCRAVSERYGEEPNRRWSDFLPDFLLIHPERCEEILSLIEREQFERPPYFELAGSAQ
jgi:hypothetical protein